MLLLLTALVSASSAPAADKSDAKEVREIQVKYGECVIKKHLKAARHFVLTPNMDDDEWRKAISKVGDGGCLVAAADAAGGIAMTFPTDMMRYTLAEALVRREFAAGPVSSIKDAAALEEPTLDEAKYQPKPGKKLNKAKLERLQESRSKRVALIYLAKFGECVVRQESIQSHALLMAQSATVEETRAFNALMPAFGNCLAPGETLKFNKTVLRGTIAMNYYRLANAPRVAATQEAAK